MVTFSLHIAFYDDKCRSRSFFFYNLLNNIPHCMNKNSVLLIIYTCLYRKEANQQQKYNIHMCIHQHNMKLLSLLEHYEFVTLLYLPGPIVNLPANHHLTTIFVVVSRIFSGFSMIICELSLLQVLPL